MKHTVESKKKPPKLNIDRHGWLRQYSGYASSSLSIPTVSTQQTRPSAAVKAKQALLKQVLHPTFPNDLKALSLIY
ncbi:1,6-anhydro-N-acetylmuramyl-L-alanine amidase AmpD [Oligella ureolytica]